MLTPFQRVPAAAFNNGDGLPARPPRNDPCMTFSDVVARTLDFRFETTSIPAVALSSVTLCIIWYPRKLGVNRHTMRRTCPVSMVLQLRLRDQRCPVWGQVAREGRYYLKA